MDFKRKYGVHRMAKDKKGVLFIMLIEKE